jgi:RTX calcium-binding nonapeptide repeat (4 copies)
MRRLAAIVAACFLLPAAPAFALPGSMGVAGDQNGATADSITIAQSATNPTVTVNNANVTDVLVTCPSAAPVQSGNSFTCPVTDAVTGISVALFSNRDRVDATSDVSIPLVVFGGPGDDDIDGGAAPDFLSGDGGDDAIDGGGGADTIIGGEDGDTLRGGDGDDHITGNEGADIIDGGNGPDTLEGDLGGDTINGQSGNDNLSGGADNDALDGGEGADSLAGDDGADLIDGGSGPDFAEGDAGDDRLLLRDDLFDQGNCGDGLDTAVGDAIDLLALDCENLDLPPLPSPPVPAPAPTPQQPATPPTNLSPSAATSTATAGSVGRPRAASRVKIRIGPSRDRKAPYVFNLVGRLTPAGGVDARTACGDVGFVDVQVRRGAAILLSLRPRLRSDCTFSARVTFRGPKRVRPTKLRFTASFLGNAYLSPARAKSVFARVGR